MKIDTNWTLSRKLFEFRLSQSRLGGGKKEDMGTKGGNVTFWKPDSADGSISAKIFSALIDTAEMARKGPLLPYQIFPRI